MFNFKPSNVKNSVMKKLVLVLVSCLLSNTMLFCALSGSGTFGTPYSGTVDSPTEWVAGTYSNNVVWVDNITINSGFTLIIGPGVTVRTKAGASMIISGTLEIGAGAGYTARTITNNNGGILRLNSDAGGIASLIHTGYIDNGGTVETEIFLNGGSIGGTPIWHYISSPVDGISASIFTSTPTTLNLAQYVESLVNSEDNTTGWIAYDGYVYTGGGSNPAYAFNLLQLCKGYTYHCSLDATRTITGPTNYSDATVTLTCGTGHSDYQGFNLIGNPFSSCLDWDMVYVDLPPGVDDAIYFTLNGTVASYVGGISDNSGTPKIPPMQGFFVKVNTPTSGIPLVLPALARIHDFDQTRYKKKSVDENYKSSDTISFVRLKMENSEISSDLVVRFNEKATALVDKRFDAYEFSKASGALNIWTTTGDVDYSINGLPFPETTLEIPIGINVKTAGTFRMKSDELNKLDGYSVFLKDILTNKSVNLKEGGSFEFEVPAGTIANRFILTITKSVTVIPEIINADKKFNIYYSSGTLNILSLTDEFNSLLSSITVYDLNGRKVFQQNDLKWQNAGELKQIKFRYSSQGVYFVEVKAGNIKYVEKVLLR